MDDGLQFFFCKTLYPEDMFSQYHFLGNYVDLHNIAQIFPPIYQFVYQFILNQLKFYPFQWCDDAYWSIIITMLFLKKIHNQL
jgi:hypothetical protein